MIISYKAHKFGTRIDPCDPHCPQPSFQTARTGGSARTYKSPCTIPQLRAFHQKPFTQYGHKFNWSFSESTPSASTITTLNDRIRGAQGRIRVCAFDDRIELHSRFCRTWYVYLPYCSDCRTRRFSCCSIHRGIGKKMHLWPSVWP